MYEINKIDWSVDTCLLVLDYYVAGLGTMCIFTFFSHCESLWYWLMLTPKVCSTSALFVSRSLYQVTYCDCGVDLFDCCKVAVHAIHLGSYCHSVAPVRNLLQLFSFWQFSVFLLALLKWWLKTFLFINVNVYIWLYSWSSCMALCYSVCVQRSQFSCRKCCCFLGWILSHSKVCI